MSSLLEQVMGRELGVPGTGEHAVFGEDMLAS